MVIVGGTFEVEPVQRDEFLARRHELMKRSRAERGCLEYLYAADPIDPNRVVLFERWDTQADLDAHLEALRADRPSASLPDPPKGSIALYDVARETPFGS